MRNALAKGILLFSSPKLSIWKGVLVSYTTILCSGLILKWALTWKQKHEWWRICILLKTWAASAASEKFFILPDFPYLHKWKIIPCSLVVWNLIHHVRRAFVFFLSNDLKMKVEIILLYQFIKMLGSRIERIILCLLNRCLAELNMAVKMLHLNKIHQWLL